MNSRKYLIRFQPAQPNLKTPAKGITNKNIFTIRGTKY